MVRPKSLWERLSSTLHAALPGAGAASTLEQALFERRSAFFVTAGGVGETSPLAGLEASYWDWGFVSYAEDGRLQSYRAGGAWRGPVTLVVDGHEIALRVNQLRLYLTPSYRLDVRPDDEQIPAAVAAWLAEFGHTLDETDVVEEYVLERGRDYHAVVRADQHELPPVAGIPQWATNPVLHLSDRPFNSLPAEAAPIPSFRGFAY